MWVSHTWVKPIRAALGEVAGELRAQDEGALDGEGPAKASAGLGQKECLGKGDR